MWPDHEDVARVLKTIPAPKPTPEEIYADVVLIRLFLTEAYGRCSNHGRHNFISASDVKKTAESFIGKTIDDTAFKIAVRMTGFQIKQSKSDKSVLLVKLPPLDRFEEVRELWNQRQAGEQKEIDQEIARWAEFRKKYPNYRP
jgi:hypothetical protein